jgi:hypothetical protein
MQQVCCFAASFNAFQTIYNIVLASVPHFHFQIIASAFRFANVAKFASTAFTTFGVLEGTFSISMFRRHA